MLPDVQAGLYMLRPPCKSTATPASGKTLTISVAPSFAAKWLLPRLPDFYDPRPDIDVRIMAICTRKTPARQLWGKIHACRARHAGGDRWPWRRARRCRARGGRSGSPATGQPVCARLATGAISSSGRRPGPPRAPKYCPSKLAVQLAAGARQRPVIDPTPAPQIGKTRYAEHQ